MSARSTDPMLDERCAHEARFFVDMLRYTRLVLLFGDGGSGKTPLLKNWVIPALSEAAPGESRHIVYFDEWNDAPLNALNARIEAALPADLVREADTPLLRYGAWTDRLAAWTAQPDQSLVLVFDHFERYLATTASDGIDAFARQWIAALAAPNLRVQFLVALRSAAEPLLTQRFGGRIASLGDNRVVLPPPPKHRRGASSRRAQALATPSSPAQATVTHHKPAQPHGTALPRVEAVATRAAPVASGAAPAAPSAEPIASSAAPIAPSAEPIASSSEPIASSSEPTTARAEPVASGAESVAVHGSDRLAPVPDEFVAAPVAAPDGAPRPEPSPLAATIPNVFRGPRPRIDPTFAAASVEGQSVAPSSAQRESAQRDVADPTGGHRNTTERASAERDAADRARGQRNAAEQKHGATTAERSAGQAHGTVQSQGHSKAQSPTPDRASQRQAPDRVSGQGAALPDRRPLQADAKGPWDGAAGASGAQRATAGRVEPRLEPAERAPAQATPMRPDLRFPPKAPALHDDTLDDDLFGPEPTEPPPNASRARRRPGAMRWGVTLIGVLAAVLLSAVFLVPPDDFRIPLRARVASSTGPAMTSPAPLRTAPTAPQPAPSSEGAPGTVLRSKPAPAAGATPGAPVPPAAPPPLAVSPPAPADALVVKPVDPRRAPPPPVAPENVARTDPPGRSPYPTEAMPRARTVPAESDAATIMARDLGSVLASAEGGTPTIRAGIGATTATGARASSDLFIARYDVLDAMRGSDSADSRNIDGLRLMVPLQVEPIYFAVRSQEQMAFVHEIVGRRINLGPGGTDAALGSAHLYLRLFDTPIASQRATYLPDGDALNALVRERSVDVVILIGRAGFSALAAQQRATPGAFKLLVFDAGSAAGKRALRSYLSLGLSPVPGNPWFERSLPSLGVMSFLVGRGFDDERSGQIVRALCQQRGRLRSTGHPYWLSVGFAPVNAPGWRYTAGAERELRSCSARWSATSEGPGAIEPPPMLSRLEAERQGTQ